MKISFPNWSLGASSINRRAMWCIIALICLLAGSYLARRYPGLLISLLIGIACFVVARFVRGRLSSNNYDRVETAPGWEEGPQVTAGWDYRPRGAIRRSMDVDLVAGPAADPSSQPSAIDESVWFDALDSSTVDHGPTVEDATEKAPLSDCADVVSTYDQSPIDNQATAVE